MSVTAELCRFPLPSGQYCRQIALKGEYLCRHHRRLLDKTQTETARQEAMEQLAERLVSLDLPDLLEALYGNLNRVRYAFRTHPEAQLALIITLERLRTMPERLSKPGYAPFPTPINFSENPMESMNYSGPLSQKTL